MYIIFLMILHVRLGISAVFKFCLLACLFVLVQGVLVSDFIQDGFIVQDWCNSQELTRLLSFFHIVFFTQQQLSCKIFYIRADFQKRRSISCHSSYRLDVKLTASFLLDSVGQRKLQSQARFKEKGGEKLHLLMGGAT